MNWGEAYFDHYERFFQRGPAQRWVYSAGGPSVQVLAFDGIFSGCRLFATLGLTHFRQRLGSTVEVVTVCDAGFDAVPNVLANACLYQANEGKGFSRGRAMSGIETIDPLFARSFHKSAVYFGSPQNFPPAFESICTAAEHGQVVGAMFISASEFAALKTLGHDAFEGALEEQEIDPFALRRPSASFTSQA